MKFLGAVAAMTLIAGAAGAQIVPLGAPIIPQPKTAVAPPPLSQIQSGSARAARPLGSNYSPYSIQPLGSVAAGAPSTLPDDKPVASGVVASPDAALLDPEAKKPAKAAPTELSDLQKLAPKAPERSDLPKADTDAPAPH